MAEIIDWLVGCGETDGFLQKACMTSFLHPDTWPFISPAKFPVLVVLIYLVAIFIGQWMTMECAPVRVSAPLIIFNAVFSIIYFIIGCLLFYCMKNSNYSLGCQPVRTRCICSNSENVIQDTEDMIPILIAIYHITKVIQLSEFVFLILENRGTSMVYILHQLSLVLLSWGAAMYVPGGTTAVMVAAACFTFPLTFLYGTLRDCSWPSYNTFALWIQIFQLVFLSWISFKAFFFNCGYPRWASFAMLAYVAQFVTMACQEIRFANEYYREGKHRPGNRRPGGDGGGLGAPWFHQ